MNNLSFELKIGLIVFLVILVFLSALFSAAETAYTAVSKTKIDFLAKSGKRSARLIKKHYGKFGWTLATILISNNLVNISSAAILTYLVGSLVSNGSSAAIISTFVMTPIIVIFGEIVPKLFAKKYSYKYLSKVCYIIEFFNWVFFPITFPLSKLALQSKTTTTEKELKHIITHANKEGVLEKNEATLAKRALDLDSILVGNIMTKKNDVIWLDKGTLIKDALETFKFSGFSRIPVKDGKTFIGIVMLKSVLFSDNKKTIDSLIDIPPTVSRYMNVTNALEIMRTNNDHMAFVTSTKESKQFVGILTIEDIVEELIGEIYDEYDKLKDIWEIEFHKFAANEKALMKDLEKELKMTFEDSENLTIKQWLQSRINRRIKSNLTYLYKRKIKFKVLSNNKKGETLIEIYKK